MEVSLAEFDAGVERLTEFVIERHAVHARRAAGQPWPWTDDPILREWGFCNVYRELDAVTRWVTVNYMYPNRDDPDVWFAAMVARFVNWPDTLAEIGYPVPWNPRQFVWAFESRRARGHQLYSGAYMISARWSSKGARKEHYLAEKVLGPAWENREALRPVMYPTLASWHEALTREYGLGSFMAAQVVADVKHHGVARTMCDWLTFAAPGPGSRRGLNRVLGIPVGTTLPVDEWLGHVDYLRNHLSINLAYRGHPVLCAQNAQNCLCEFDKYERVRLGEGQPKMRYRRPE